MTVHMNDCINCSAVSQSNVQPQYIGTVEGVETYSSQFQLSMLAHVTSCWELWTSLYMYRYQCTVQRLYIYIALQLLLWTENPFFMFTQY